MIKNGGRTVITGAGGFLGFHLRTLLHSRGQVTEALALGEEFNLEAALEMVDGADRLIHVAGVNRGSDDDVRQGNLTFAQQLGDVLSKCQQPPGVVTYANSIQSFNDSVYGHAKAEAARRLGGAVAAVGSTFVDVPLPNLFGEHGRPFYNSVTSTFCYLLARGEAPAVKQDKVLPLMHGLRAAELLAADASCGSLQEYVVKRSVGDLLRQLTEIANTYRDGTIPPLSSAFDRDLFNTYRSYLAPEARVFRLNRHADERGSFFEMVKSQQSSSQSSFSTTVPGVTRGQHYHLRKIERFTVISGTGTIAMRRLWSDEVQTYSVSGESPVAIDMPTMWAHNISNTGDEVMHTAFWIDELFDRTYPDTFAENV